MYKELGGGVVNGDRKDIFCEGDKMKIENIFVEDFRVNRFYSFDNISY